MIYFTNLDGDAITMPKHLFEGGVRSSIGSFFVKFNGCIEELDEEQYEAVLKQLSDVSSS